MNILKIPREAAVPRKVLVKLDLTLDCSMIKATIGIVTFAACDNYRPHFNKIEAQFESVALFSNLEKLSSLCCTASIQSCVGRIAKERRNLSSFDMKTSPHRAAIFFFAFHGSYYPSERE